MDLSRKEEMHRMLSGSAVMLDWLRLNPSVCELVWDQPVRTWGGWGWGAGLRTLSLEPS